MKIKKYILFFFSMNLPIGKCNTLIKYLRKELHFPTGKSNFIKKQLLFNLIDLVS